MIKAILWDNDGVLVDTEKFYYQSTKEILSKYDVDLTKDLYIQNLLINSCGAWHLIPENKLPDPDISKLRTARNLRYSELIKSSSLLIDGVADTLRSLHKKYKMAIVTSCIKAHFDLIHSTTNILQYIDFVLTREAYKVSKPDPEPYLLAVEKLALPKEECLVIEDSQRGLLAAQAAGIRCWVIPNEFTKGLDFSFASKILTNIAEVEIELSKINGSYPSH